MFAEDKRDKVDLSDFRSLSLSLKQHLADDSSDHAIQLILDHMRYLDTPTKDAL